MKYLRKAGPWAIRAYLLYSICVDLAVVGTATWYFLIR